MAKISTQCPLLQLLVPGPGRKELSYHTMLRCLVDIWVVIEHWHDFLIDFIVLVCLMTSNNGSASASCAPRGSHQLDNITHWVIFRPVIAVTLHRTATATFW